MTETSGLWTTSGTPTGHQVSSYTQAIASTMLAVAAACSGFEGVAPGYLNELAPSSTGSNNCRIASGGAMVDGKYYKNDASVDFTIPSATPSGYSRIDRIVVRCTWASYQAVLTRIAGTDAVEPTAPSITQTSGSVYDIPICRVLVNDAGYITITDERKWAIVDTDGSTLENNAGALRVKDGGITAAKLATNAVTTAKIADDAITGAKIADDQIDSDHYVDGSINYAHLASGASKFTHRKGGSASDWSTTGTTSYTPTSVRIQGGAHGLVSPGTITFPVAFSNAPLVYVTIASNTSARVRVYSVTATNFVVQTEGDVACTINWLAIGPE